jgi:crotonobetainyl-CoA:carnitine CoA-transferase CaiB-like acyl-CoA transferase
MVGQMAPLTGIRVVEVGTVLMAPYAGQWLADLGADVIKVEPESGDQTRYTGPTVEQGMASMFLALNRNKRSIAIDLKSEQGRDELHRMLPSTDVLIHNIRPQKLADLGLDAATVTALNPSIIYAGLSGFTAGGPYAGRPAYDDIIQGMTGVADLVHRQTGEFRYAPMALADKTCGLVAALAICAALMGREQTGNGTIVEVPMFETMVAFNMVENFAGSHFNEQGVMGYGRTLAANRGPYRTSDGYVSFMPYTDQQWQAFFNAIGREEVAADPRFVDIGSRTENIDALYEILAAQMLTRETAGWLALADELQIPAGPVMSLEEIAKDRHLAEVEFFVTAVDQTMGNLRFPGVPVTFDGVRPLVRLPPRLNEQRDEICAEMGLGNGRGANVSGGSSGGPRDASD